jgi:hypothetical protein
VELLLDIARDEHDRLSGTVRLSDESSGHTFSGILDLVRVFEELVPATGPAPAHEGELSESEKRA